MSIGLYQSASSLAALERWQDAVTQNITSSQVSGYKKRTVEFSMVAAGEVQTNPRQKIGHGEGEPMYFPKATYGINFQSGETEPTRRELDVALQGEGFFEVQMNDGRKGYTRAGELHLRPDRTIVTSQDQPILSDSGFPLQLLPQGGTIVINTDGMIRQGDTPVGRISVVKFADEKKLVPISAGLFVANGGPDPTTVEKPQVLQGYLESSNVAALHEMVNLVNISRAYEANQKLIQSYDQTMQKTLDALG
ncbi:flagellar hook-basal body protein [Rariglobus hedericola]|uniref:Flagellar hook-basal body protein n=1 Tax=Rariglobus hedericola TaxID=2597822 RepID=A0A556QPQ8_9BACT|nr:flagellar hook-basal body protein [Rariglobus hedericola]TSJ78634.1 flagellar hook-basal body protein [Rariglobus hedericola]